MIDEPTNAQASELAINTRALLARLLQGQTAYQGDRDYYQVLGYPVEITIAQYWQRYTRQDIAQRIVDLPAVDSWKEPPALSEGDDDRETAFVAEFDTLDNRLHVWNALCRADRLSGVGEFGVLLIGFKDGGELKNAVDADKINGQKSILYMRALSQAVVTIGDLDEEQQSARFGQPLNYKVNLGKGDKEIHWSRIVHLAENKLDNDVLGIPRLRSSFNLLDDKMKAVGGTAEATWLNMRPGIAVGPEDEYDWDESEWLTAVQDYAHDPLRMLKAIGLKVEPIGTSEIADPTGPHDVIIADIAAASGIPQRVLIGSAGGDLSAAKEDTRQWASAISNRQTNYAEPEILRPFIDRLVALGALPTPVDGPGAYNVGTLQRDGVYLWPSIIELDEAEKAAAARDKAAAVNSLASIDSGLLDDDEKRQILGLPPRDVPESDFESVESSVPETVAQNFREGKITANQLLAYVYADELEKAGGLDE